MAFSEITDSINQTGNKIQDYVESMAEYFKLRLFKSAMKFSTALVNMLVIGFIAFLFLIFVSIGGALYLSSVIGNPFAGFLIIAGFYLLVLILTLVFGKAFIERKMLFKFSDLLIEEDDFNPKKMAEENLKLDDLEEEKRDVLENLNEKPVV